MTAKRLIIVSDNHGKIQPLSYILSLRQQDDILIHCGDSNLIPSLTKGFAIVQGNTDPYGMYPGELVLEINEHVILVTHGHLDLRNGIEALVKRAKRYGCDIVCYGHTHIPDDETIDGIRLLNPGSLSNNRDGSSPSYMVVDLAEGEFEVTLMRYE